MGEMKEGGLLAALAARRRFGMKPGLDSITRLCSALGDPQNAFPAIHVAGTDGKGAVCAMLDAALGASGLSAGRYTSPHLVRLAERFFVRGSPASDETLARLAARVEAAVETIPGEETTFFEALTAVAFLLYAETRPDYAILETGLGGRLDATNICKSSICAITRIGLDHCDWLGDTVAKIAAEKAGIIKEGVPIVLGANSAEVREIVAEAAARKRAPFVYAPDAAREDEIPQGFPLGGRFNRENAVTAIATLKTLAKADPRIDAAKAVDGLRATVWPGRFHRAGRFIVDGAHNPPAAAALAESLPADGRVELIAGFCEDKDVRKVLQTLAPRVSRAFAVAIRNPRTMSAAKLAETMRAEGIAAEPCATLEEALERTAGPTLVCGSLFLAGEALVALGAYPWPAAGAPDPAELLRPCAKTAR